MLDILKAIESLTKILDWILRRRDKNKYPTNKEIAIGVSKNVGELIDHFEKVAERILLLFEERSVERGGTVYITYPYRVRLDSLNRELLKTFREMQLVYWDLFTIRS